MKAHAAACSMLRPACCGPAAGVLRAAAGLTKADAPAADETRRNAAQTLNRLKYVDHPLGDHGASRTAIFRHVRCGRVRFQRLGAFPAFHHGECIVA